MGLPKEFPESGMCAGRGDGGTVAREPRVLLLIPSGFLVEAPGMRTGTAGEPWGLLTLPAPGGEPLPPPQTFQAPPAARPG